MIKDNPPPLPDWDGWNDSVIRKIQSAAFAQGVAAMQTEINGWKALAEGFRAKLKALEEQKPVAYLRAETTPIEFGGYGPATKDDPNGFPVYLAAGAKHD